MLSCCLFNARSLRNKLSDLHFLLASNQFSCIFICESWLSDDVTDAMLTGRFDYNVHRYDRTYSNGGGCCVLVKRLVKCTRVKFSAIDGHCWNSLGVR